jgi:hypothetical protein
MEAIQERSTGRIIFDLSGKMGVDYGTADQVLAVILEDKEFSELFKKLWNKHGQEIQFILQEYNIFRELREVLKNGK